MPTWPEPREAAEAAAAPATVVPRRTAEATSADAQAMMGTWRRRDGVGRDGTRGRCRRRSMPQHLMALSSWSLSSARTPCTPGEPGIRRTTAGGRRWCSALTNGLGLLSAATACSRHCVGIVPRTFCPSPLSSRICQPSSQARSDSPQDGEKATRNSGTTHGQAGAPERRALGGRCTGAPRDSGAAWLRVSTVANHPTIHGSGSRRNEGGMLRCPR